MNSIRLPEKSISIDQCTTIIETHFFVLSQIATIRANIQRKAAEPYINRLKTFKTVLENQYNIDQSIKPIKAMIQPERLYLSYEINELIRTFTGTKTIPYSAIIDRLIQNKIIELNPFYPGA